MSAIRDRLASSSRPDAALLLRGFGWAALAAFIFAGWFIVTRFTVTHDLTVWDVTALRFGIGAVLLAPVLVRSRNGIPARAFRDGLILAVLWGAPFVLLVAIGLQLTSAAQASSVTPALMPVFAGLLGWALHGQRPGAGRLAGYAAVVAGQAVLMASAAMAAGTVPSPAGIVVLILAALMWAIYTHRFRRSGLSALQGTAPVCVWSAILYVPAYLLSGTTNLLTVGWRELAFQSVYQGVLMSVVAILAFNRAVALLGPAAATAVIALLPVLTTVLAIPTLGEMPTAAGAVAVVVIGTGVFLAARPGR